MIRRCGIGVLLLVALTSCSDRDTTAHPERTEQPAFSVTGQQLPASHRAVAEAIAYDVDKVQITPTWWSVLHEPNGLDYPTIGVSVKNIADEPLAALQPFAKFTGQDQKTIDYVLLDNGRYKFLGSLAAGQAMEMQFSFQHLAPDALKNGVLQIGDGSWMGDFTTLAKHDIPAPAPTTTTPAAVETTTAPAADVVDLDSYCQTTGDTAVSSDGATVYCARVQYTDAHVWSLTPGLVASDPNVPPPVVETETQIPSGNTRGYTCYSSGCVWPDGTPVIGADRCGRACGEPPTSGDMQSEWTDCIAIKPVEVCREELNN